jgi:hypothetical protein
MREKRTSKSRHPQKPDSGYYEDLTEAEKAEIQAELDADESLRPPAPRYCEHPKPTDDIPF